MRLQAFRASALGIAMFTAISTALAQHSGLVTRSVPRDPMPHVVGHAVLSPQVVTTWGGVVGQADALMIQGEPVTDLRLRLALDESDDDGLRVDFGGTSLVYPIQYSDLVPMALFVESGGTGLYTAFPSSQLDDDFDTRAGTIVLDSGDRIALEFAGTAFEAALYEVDHCIDCLVAAPERFQTLADSVEYEWQNIRGWIIDANNRRESSYINTDFGSDVLVETNGNQLELTSTIARYDWFAELDQVNMISFGFEKINLLERPDRRKVMEAISNFDELIRQYEEATDHLYNLGDGGLAFRLGEIAARADDLASPFESGRDVADALSALAEEVRDAVETRELAEQSLDEQSFEDPRELKPLVDGYFLIETLALLRTARRLNPEAFEKFMATLRAPELVEARRESWERYSRSFCSVYPHDPECADG